MGKKLKYLYIEDTNDSTTESFRVALESSGKIEIELVTVQSFENQIDYILEKDIQGVILDLKLDENPTFNGTPVRYTAPALAQALRSKYTDLLQRGHRADIPIILFSTDENLTNSYQYDFSSHDLFDFRMSKANTSKYGMYSKQLYSIANGYININTSSNINIDDLIQFDSSLLDSRIFEGFGSKVRLTTFEYSQRILRGLIFYDSPLIDEYLLTARLGVDITSEGWSDLRDIFSKAKYKGIFADVWERWWMPVVNHIFTKISEGESLSNLRAKERISYLQKTVSKQLTAATPIEGSKSTRFWTICRCYNRPLDPSEGFRIIRCNNPQPWHDNQYISLKAALERDYVGKFTLEDIELAKLQTLKDGLK